MTQPARPAIESPDDAQLHALGATSSGAAHVLMTMAKASYAAAATVFVLMTAVYIYSEWGDRVGDWPAQYWFAVLPLVVGARVLQRSATKLAPPVTPEGSTDWYQ